MPSLVHAVSSDSAGQKSHATENPRSTSLRVFNVGTLVVGASQYCLTADLPKGMDKRLLLRWCCSSCSHFLSGRHQRCYTTLPDLNYVAYLVEILYCWLQS